MLAAAVACAFIATAYAQQPSSKVVRLVLPFPTGPGLIIGQVLTEGLRETFKQGAVVDNRSGGGGRLTYGSSGPGSTNHLVTELFSILAKVKMTHAPYKSATFAVLDLVRGDVDMVIGVITSVQQFIPSGKLRVIAVLSTKRMADRPDIPTGVEQGMPDLVAVNYYGVLAPGGTPAQIVDRLHQQITRILKTPESQKIMAKADIEPVLTTPSEFAEFIRKDSAKWARVVREANIKLE